MILAFTHAAYVAAGWASVTAAIGAYVVATLRRGRRLSRLVPDEERRWSGS